MAATAAASAAAAAAANSDEDDNYEEYIPVAKRRAMEAERLRQLRLSKPAPASAANRTGLLACRGGPSALPFAGTGGVAAIRAYLSYAVNRR